MSIKEKIEQIHRKAVITALSEMCSIEEEIQENNRRNLVSFCLKRVKKVKMSILTQYLLDRALSRKN